MASQFNDKVVIVTGSNSGLGETISLAFASRGAKVTFCGRDPERLKSVLEKATQVSGGHQDTFLAVPGDLNDKNVRKEIIDQTIEKFGRLDILVANAGVTGVMDGPLKNTEENYDTVMDTNLKSVFFLIQQAVPHLEKTEGNIVTISSNITSFVVPAATVYSLSKVALDHLTRCLVVDLGAKGIRVNAVNPGFFPTRLTRDVGDADKINDIFGKQQRDNQPLKGRIGIAEDVAEAVIFLASDAAGFITGEHIKVDGGRHMTGISLS